MAEWIVEIGDGNPHIRSIKELVRCEECKYRNWETNGCNRNPCVEPWWEGDYCSYGEKVKE